jgi:two-component system sensor histidine kinase BaeS
MSPSLRAKPLFLTMLLSFAVSLVFFLVLMTVLIYVGFRRSAEGWGQERFKALEKAVEAELRASSPEGVLRVDERLRVQLDAIIPHGTTLIIYDRDMQEVYARLRGARGRGRHAMDGRAATEDLSLQQVRRDGSVIAHYRLGAVNFGMDRANTRFLESMRRTLWLSIPLALVLALLFSALLSRKIASSTRSVAEGIGRIAGGDLSSRIDSRGPREIAEIAESANELGKKLEREEQLRGQWAADIAHDLRTPLGGLRSQLEGMADGVLDMSRNRIKNTLRELARMELLVQDLGELTRLESPEIRIRPTTIRARDLADELQNRFSKERAKKDIRFDWALEIEEFGGDDHLILRALSNLLSNAVRHTQQGGTISIRFEKQNSRIRIRITNTGRGIPREELPRVFDRLYRGEYARNSPGSGLGLTIARKIVELHGGEIGITSSAEGPTTVEMLIPERV